MSSKVVFNDDYFQEKDYEKELEKVLALNSVLHGYLFYLVASYCKLVKNLEFISEKSYQKLCDYLAESNHSSLAENLGEFKAYTCKLRLKKKDEEFSPKLHYPVQIDKLLESIEESIEIDYKLEVYE